MITYSLRATDLQVSALSLGTMRIAYGKTIEEVETLVKTALDNGINFFDLADIYGGGKSEEMFGEVLKRNPGIREKMIIQSKCSIVPGIMYDFSKEHIIHSVEKSLQRMQIDYLDVLLLHRPDALCDPKEVAEAFDELYQKGKVKFFGVSNHNAMQIELLQKFCHQPILINQLQLSIVHSGMIDSGINVNMDNTGSIDHDGSTLDYCRIHDILIQPWSSLQASWADGTFIDNPKYPKLNEVLSELSMKYSVSKSAIAIAWLLRHPAGFQPIVGTTSPQHLLEVIKGTEIKLTRQEWYALYLANGKTLP